MSWLRSIASAILGSDDASAQPGSDLLCVEGALFLDRPDAIRGGHQCIFPHATLALRRGEVPHSFYLVVTRTVDEDEQEFSDSDKGDDSDDDDDLAAIGNERAFVLSTSMRFHTGECADEGLATVRWIEGDGAGSPDDIYEFALPGSRTSPTFKLLRESVLQCLYERTFQRSHENASEAELDALLWVPTSKSGGKSSKGKGKPKAAAAAAAAAAPAPRKQAPSNPTTPTRPAAPSSKNTPRAGSPTPRSDAPQKAAAAAAAAPPSPSKTKPSSTSSATVIEPPVVSLRGLLPRPPAMPESMDLALELDAELFVYEVSSGEFCIVEKNCTIQLWADRVKGAAAGAWVAVEAASGALVCQPLTTSMNHVFWPENLAFIWNLYYSVAPKKPMTKRGGAAAAAASDCMQCLSLAVELGSDSEFKQFRRAFTEIHIQATLEASLKAMSLDDTDMDYIEQQAGQLGGAAKPTNRDRFAALSDDEDSDDNSDKDSDEDEDEEDDLPDHVVDDDDVNSDADDDKNATNSVLTTTRDRAYVVRGGSIGVFGFDNRGHVKFETQVKKVRFNREPVRANKVLLLDNEASMVLSDPRDASKLYKLDLATETVVDEWNIGHKVRDMSAALKSAESASGGDATFLGVSDRSVFRVDPRLAGGTVVDSGHEYTYSKSMDICSVATSSGGQVAVGSNKGELRLFSNVGKRATTALVGASEPIAHLDVSMDGHYVLATAVSSLLLYDVALVTAKGVETTAFTSRMPAKGRPPATRLTLRPEHLAKLSSGANGMVKFKPAKFNVSPNGETSLVTSTGPYVISWLLKDVLDGRVNRYTVKQFAETVADDQFRFGDDGRIVVALPNDVTSVARSQLKRVARL
ncbi:VID27 cytoplasmic protein-domain-containing protein [Blastocladiella britannica]|nr:VID27 cytoplasmic protein-domain-containing protein [Blastocladiella britannica]